MDFKGFDEASYRKAFEWYLHHPQPFSRVRSTGPDTSIPFSTRALSHKGGGNNPNLSRDQWAQSDKDFRNAMALTYLKTFYGKNPSDFKTKEYQEECSRLSSFIASSSNPSALKKKIEKCLREGHVDYESSGLPSGVFYKGLSEIGLSTDSLDHSIFITPKYVTGGRIYINPSQRYYGDLMAYLYEHAASQELAIGTKTRLESITYSDLDNMIIYASTEDLPKIVDILNEYGRTYPEKVAEFGDTIEFLGRGEQEWFGFGCDPQRLPDRAAGIETFNTLIDNIFNFYIFPAIMFDDLDEITKGMSDDQLTDIFARACPDREVARKVALALKDPELRRQFINNFCDLTYVREKSESYTKENEKESPEKLRGCTPEQARFKPVTDGGRLLYGQYDDDKLMQSQKITIPLKDGTTVVLTRNNIAKIMGSPVLRKAMEDHYDTEEEIQREVSQMAWLWKNVCKNMTYLDEEHPFLSRGLRKSFEAHEAAKKGASKEAPKPKAEESSPKRLEGYERWVERQTIKKGIEEKHKKQEEIIKVLCRGGFDITAQLFKMGVAPEEIQSISLEELQKIYIYKVGLDEVIDAASYVKSTETDGKKLNHRYENALQALRHQRGKALCERIKGMSTDEERERYALSLSQHAREDVVREYEWHKSLAKLDEFIGGLE